jgi:hypothetical protein
MLLGTPDTGVGKARSCRAGLLPGKGHDPLAVAGAAR